MKLRARHQRAKHDLVERTIVMPGVMRLRDVPFGRFDLFVRLLNGRTTSTLTYDGHGSIWN